MKTKEETKTSGAMEGIVKQTSQPNQEMMAKISMKPLKSTRQELAETEQPENRNRADFETINGTYRQIGDKRSSYCGKTMSKQTAQEIGITKQTNIWKVEAEIDRQIRQFNRQYGIAPKKQIAPQTYPDGSSRKLELAPEIPNADRPTEIATTINYIDPAIGHSAVLWNHAVRILYRRAWHRSHRENDRRNQQAYRDRQKAKKQAALILVQAEAATA
jgi:hypothetical protein